MASPRKLLFKPVITEMQRTLNISAIINTIDLESYTNKQFLQGEEFFSDDLVFKIRCYPKGTLDTEIDFISIYLYISNIKPNDRRKIHVAMTVDDKCKDFVQPLHKLKDGWGWPQALAHSKLAQNPYIGFHIKIMHDPAFVTKKNIETFAEQNAKMHQLSMEHGDVTLMIKVHQQHNSSNHVNDEDGSAFYVPSKKKRKINQDYDAKNDLEENEIKMSSVILRSASKVFDRMLDNDMMEKRQKRIEVQAKSVEDVKDLLHFMSTDTLKKTANASALIELAHYYEMERLFWRCVYRLVQTVSVYNFVRIINIFEKYQIDKGYKSFVTFAKNHKEEIKTLEDFRQIPHSFRCVVFHED